MLIYTLRLSITVWTVTRLSRIDEYEFDAICISPKTVGSEPGIAIFVIGEILNQFVIHTLTIRKTWALKGAWDRTPTLPSVLTRDGFYVFVAIFGMWLHTSICGSSAENQ
ncbi:hypothetical protein WG66_005570 [Moniliophthora roreri]|nr:hypothetical protein WG66_005570 [Moniliophthora roreri]